MVKRVGSTDLLKGHVLACVFYEPSTRTSSSFIAAMSRLGGSVIPINEVRYSSVTKGESLPDTIRTLESYADVIVLRHPDVGASTVAAEYARKPIINAGDGVGEHPTQALLDLYTIQSELGTIDGLHVAMVGDLRYGRTVHSLARLLCLYDVQMTFVSPEILRLPLDVMNEVKGYGRPVHETYDVHEVIADVDVLYVTRVQRERFADQAQYEAVKDYYVITAGTDGTGQGAHGGHASPAPRRRDQLCHRRRSPGGLLPADGKRHVHPHGPAGGGAGQSVIEGQRSMSLMRIYSWPSRAASWLREMMVRFGPARSMARRFVAGETLEEAIAAVQALNGQGLLATLDHLGENMSSETEARDATTEVLDLLEAIEASGAPVGRVGQADPAWPGSEPGAGRRKPGAHRGPRRPGRALCAHRHGEL